MQKWRICDSVVKPFHFFSDGSDHSIEVSHFLCSFVPSRLARRHSTRLAFFHLHITSPTPLSPHTSQLFVKIYLMRLFTCLSLRMSSAMTHQSIQSSMSSPPSSPLPPHSPSSIRIIEFLDTLHMNHVKSVLCFKLHVISPVRPFLLLSYPTTACAVNSRTCLMWLTSRPCSATTSPSSPLSPRGT